MRLSELRGLLANLAFAAEQCGNNDPVLEFYDLDNVLECFVPDMQAISKDPAVHITDGGAIHIPLIRIINRGFVVKYSEENSSTEQSVIIQAETNYDAEKLFLQRFSTAKVISVTAEQ